MTMSTNDWNSDFAFIDVFETPDPTDDWQQTVLTNKEKLQYLFETKKFSDCTFTFEKENDPHQEEISSHKLVLAMASPVFEVMFFGEIPHENKPIPIVDVHPDAFQTVLEYIYTEDMQITSVEKAFNILYAARKYMLPVVEKLSIKFLLSAISSKNVIESYELAKFFDEKELIKTCMEVIRTKTLEVFNEPNFKDANLNTILEILDQDYLNIDSELDLFNTVKLYLATHNPMEEMKKSSLSQPTESQLVATTINNNSELVCKTEESANGSCKTVSKQKRKKSVAKEKIYGSKNGLPVLKSSKPDYRLPLKKIRYLTLSPEQFATGPGKSNLLKPEEIISIFMNISMVDADCLMPKGFTQNRCRRNEIIKKESNNKVCVRSIINRNEYKQESVSQCSLTFQTDSSVSIIGIKVQSRIVSSSSYYNGSYHTNSYGNSASKYAYLEAMYACINDSNGSTLTYGHYNSCTNSNGAEITILFNQEIFIQKGENYRVCVYFNKTESYHIFKVDNQVICDDVIFYFNRGQLQDSVQDGLIHGIIFHNPIKIQ